MDRTEAATLLRRELRGYAGRDHAELARLVGDGDTYELEGSGVAYQIEVDAFWEGPAGGAIRVIGSIDDGTFRAAFQPLTDSFVKFADGVVDAGWGDEAPPAGR